MKLDGITYSGPEIDDPEILNRLPASYRKLLEETNGFILFGGGLHVRGACHSPEWHSLRRVWFGNFALRQRYPALAESDIPFAQDCVGDQFILKGDVVHRLSGEDGAMESMSVDLEEFLSRAQLNPVEYLALQPLMRHHNEGGDLRPGQLLSIYPPFCTQESAKGVSIRAIAMFERLEFLAALSAILAGLSEGAQLRVVVKGRDSTDPSSAAET